MNFEFKNPYMVTTRGREIEVHGLVVEAPTAKSRAFCAVLDNELNAAQVNAAKRFKSFDVSEEEKAEAKEKRESKKNGEDGEWDSETVLAFLASGGADMNKCYNSLDEILKRSGAQVEVDDGKMEKATSDFMENMPYEDQKRLLGEYIANFIATS